MICGPHLMSDPGALSRALKHERSKEGETLSRSYELVQSKYSENMSVV